MHFKKFTFFAFLMTLMMLPINTLAYSKYLIPGGENIGIKVNSKYITVVGFYEVNNKYIAKDAGFNVGDKIIEINSNKITSMEDMVNSINSSKDNLKLNIKVLRSNKEYTIVLNVSKDNTGVIKTGLYVKDQISGIGTLTYIDPETRKFGALGHEIIEKVNSEKVEIKDGTIFKSDIIGIKKSVDGTPGEKNAKFYSSTLYGDVTLNANSGIYGNYIADLPNKDAIEVMDEKDVKVGKAVIRTVIKDNSVDEFEIKILELDYSSNTKNILFEIVDERLLKNTGGVVAGMSGSPIIQDGKIVGAVNYVVVNKVNKGYGIFITNMLNTSEEE